MITQDFDITDSRYERPVFRNELPQLRVFGLGRIDNDVAVDQHQESRLGRLRSSRIVRSQACGSLIVAKAPRLASCSSNAAIRGPDFSLFPIGASSSKIVTCTAIACSGV